MDIAIREEFFLKPYCSRNDIVRLEQYLNQITAGLDIKPEVLAPLNHYFAPGLYIREIFIPAGTVIVGKIHKHAHFNDISSGRILVATEFGNEEFVAPHRFTSIPGTKRAVLALEDTVWTTYHPTNKTDLKEIEEEVIAGSFEEFDQFYLLEKAA